MSAVPANQAAGMSGDAAFSMFAKFGYLLTRLGLPPLILAHASLQEYGLWSACFIVVGYIGIADLGFSSVYIRGTARLHMAGDVRGLGRLISTGVSCMSVLALLMFGGLVLAMPALLAALRIGVEQQPLARILILGSAAIFLADMCLNAYAYALHGMQRFRAEQQVWVMAFLLELVLIVILLLSGAGIYALLVAFALRYAFSIVANMRLVYRSLPGLVVGPRQFDRSLLPEFLQIGLRIQLSTIFSVALHSADRLVAGTLLGPQAIGLFDLGSKLPVSASSIPSAITQLAQPAAARLATGADPQAVRQLADLFAQTTRSVAILAAVPMAFLAVFATPFSFAWLGAHPDLAFVPLLMSLSAVATCVHISTGPGTAVLRGMGQIGSEFIYHGLRITCLVAGVGFAYAVQGLSVAALACGLAAGSTTAALLYLLYLHHRLAVPLAALLRQVIVPAVVPFLVALVLLLAWHAGMPATAGRWPTLGVLFVFGMLHCLLSAAALWHLLTAEEQATMAKLARRCLQMWPQRSKV